MIEPSGQPIPVPTPPDDGYDWKTFIGDQERRPIAWHGTSSIFRDSIQKHGVTINRERRELKVIDRLLKTVPSKGWSSDVSTALAILGTWTQSTAELNSLCFTFDYVHALNFAVRNRGGETLTALNVALTAALQDFAETLPASDLEWIRAEGKHLEGVLAEHRPLLIGVRFDPEIFSKSPYANAPACLYERTAFENDIKDSFFPSFVIGHYERKRIRRGREFRTSVNIPAERIERWIELNTNEVQSVKQFFAANPWI